MTISADASPPMPPKTPGTGFLNCVLILLSGENAEGVR